MLFSIMENMGDMEAMRLQLRLQLISLLLSLPVIIFSLSLHETAHGYVAWKCGDPTAYNLGRLTLNPLKHLDPIGFLCMLIFGFGWAKPVPINTRNFINPKRGMALSALAGPGANFALGFIHALIGSLLDALPVQNSLVWSVVQLFFYYGAVLNFMLMLFNLIPVPPFDGSRIALSVLPTKTYFKLMQHERTVMWVLLGLMFACNYLFNFSPFSAGADLLTNLFYRLFGGLFSLIFG